MLSDGFVKDTWRNHIKNAILKNRLEDKWNSVPHPLEKNLVVSWAGFLRKINGWDLQKVNCDLSSVITPVFLNL